MIAVTVLFHDMHMTRLGSVRHPPDRVSFRTLIRQIDTAQSTSRRLWRKWTSADAVDSAAASHISIELVWPSRRERPRCNCHLNPDLTFESHLTTCIISPFIIVTFFFWILHPHPTITHPTFYVTGDDHQKNSFPCKLYWVHLFYIGQPSIIAHSFDFKLSLRCLFDYLSLLALSHSLFFSPTLGWSVVIKWSIFFRQQQQQQTTLPFCCFIYFSPFAIIGHDIIIITNFFFVGWKSNHSWLQENSKQNKNTNKRKT